MHRKLISVVMLSVLVLNMAALVFDVRPVKAAGTIYIHADGSIDPPSAPIVTSDNRTYLLMDNTFDSIVIERSNTMFHGNNYTVQGSGSGVGFDLNSVTNVTVEDTRIVNFQLGVNVHNSAQLNHVLANTLVQNQEGIEVSSSNDNHVWANSIVNCTYVGIFLDNGTGNTVEGNHVWGGGSQGIQLGEANSNILLENTIEYCSQGLGINFSSYNNVKLNVIRNSVGEPGDGVFLTGSPFNTLTENTLTANSHGVGFVVSNDSSFYHNNFLNNTLQVYDYSYSPPYLGAPRSCNAWDNGYPWGGNYWSSYNGTDLYKGPHQNETDSDGIGDTPYSVDVNNRDNYPLMQSWALGTKYSWPMFHGDVGHTGFSGSPSPETNQTCWNYLTGGEVYSSPAVANGIVFVGSNDSRLYALDQYDGTQVWNYTTGGAVPEAGQSSPAVSNGKVYVGSLDGKIYCLDASTGHSVWNYTTGGVVFSSPTVANGMVYAGSWDDKVYCLPQNDPNADGIISPGEVIWSFTTGGWITSSPAVVGNKVYVGSVDGKVYCLDAFTGAQVWNYTTGSLVLSSPAIADGKVYVGSDDDRLYCLDASAGNSVWNYTTDGRVRSSPAVASGMVYVGSDDGTLYCLNASTGSSVWNYTTTNWVQSSPAVADGKVYFVTFDGRVNCVNSSTGQSLWSYTTGTKEWSSPAVSDGIVFIGSADHNVYAFGSVIRVPENYGSIQQAINAAAPGDTIWVDPGVYHESIVINKTVTLLGKIGSPPPVFQGGGSGVAINITAAGSGSTVADFAITNWAQGILINDASTCKIYDNIMSQMSNGAVVVQGGASQNSIYGNIITQSQVGINITGSNNNMIYYNNFIGNVIQLSIYASIGNVLDSGFPSGGNFWSDYKQKYPNAHEMDASGIWDTAYAVDANNKDHYPLKIPYGYRNSPIPGDVDGDTKVDMGDIVALCDAFGSKPGKPNWNPNCDLDNDGKITMGDIVIGLDHFGQHYP